MENNSNAIAEIQKKYAGCNLLMPAATEVQLNPFYKITVMEVTADLSENSGDIFKVGSVKTGTTQQGKDIWEETYSPAKPLLMKIAAAAGIQFDPDHTYGTRVDENTYRAKAYGAMRMPDGTGKTHADEKEICLNDEEANYRIEFMDKSIKGITDEKAAKAAAEMFKGNWIDAKNKWGKACKAYVIDDCDREKYIERSVLVNMTLLRKTAAAKAMTGAILRVIRALTGMKCQYTKKELQKKALDEAFDADRTYKAKMQELTDVRYERSTLIAKYNAVREGLENKLAGLKKQAELQVHHGSGTKAQEWQLCHGKGFRSLRMGRGLLQTG